MRKELIFQRIKILDKLLYIRLDIKYTINL